MYFSRDAPNGVKICIGGDIFGGLQIRGPKMELFAQFIFGVSSSLLAMCRKYDH